MENAQRYHKKYFVSPGIHRWGEYDTDSNTLDINIHKKEVPTSIRTLNPWEPPLCNDPKRMKHHTIATPPNWQWKVEFLGQYVMVLLF